MGAQPGTPLPEIYVSRIVLSDPAIGAQAGDLVLTSKNGQLQIGNSILPDNVLADLVRIYHLQVVPRTVATNAIHAAALLGVGGVITTGITQPVVPCVLSATGVGAGATGNVIIAGTNVKDQAITDTIALAGATTVEGAKAFKTVTQYTAPADSGATGETLAIGITKKIGLLHDLSYNWLLKALFDGANDAGTLTVDSDEVEKNFYAVAGTPNSVKILDLFYYVS